VLGQFVADVRTLKSSGQLSESYARRLDTEARATAAQAATRLHRKVASAARTTSTVRASDSTSATQPTVTSTVQSNYPADSQNDQAQGDGSDSAWSGRGDGHGHGDAHGGGGD
jgi:hypothetical protein